MKAADAVKRYDLDTEIDGARMAENELGDFVSYDDHVAAITAAEERERVLREAIAEIIRDHDERDMLFPGTERQAYRIKVMDAGRAALATPAPEPSEQKAGQQ